MPVPDALRGHDAVLVDLDAAGEGANPETVAALHEAGISVAYITRDPRPSPEELVRSLWMRGLQAAVSDLVTAGVGAQHVLSDRGGGSAFVIGTLALVGHVADGGMRIVNRTEFASRADVVVVGVHDHVTYEELRIAAQAAMRGAQLVATSRDVLLPGTDEPGAGAMLAAVEAASGRVADIVIGDLLPEIAAERLGAGNPATIGIG